MYESPNSLSVGAILEFKGTRFRLLPTLEIIFGSGTTTEEPPIAASSPDEAYRVVRNRYPEAHWQRWDQQNPINNGFMFDFAGDDDQDGQISLCFYAEPVDVVHEEFCPRGSNQVHNVGWITWFLAPEK